MVNDEEIRIINERNFETFKTLLSSHNLKNVIESSSAEESYNLFLDEYQTLLYRAFPLKKTKKETNKT